MPASEELIRLANAIDYALDDFHIRPRLDEFDRPSMYFRSPDGAGFYIKTDPYGDDSRVYVGALWPDSCEINGILASFQPYFSSYASPPEKSPSITCAKSRGGKAIAADIERRFLPAYLPLWDKQSDQQVRELARGERDRILLNQLNQCANSAGQASFDQPGPRLYISDGRPTINGTVAQSYKLHTYDGVNVTAELRNLSMDQAKAIIRLLNDGGADNA